MKFLVNIEPNGLQVPPDKLVPMVKALRAEGQAQLQSRAAECIYNTAPGSGIVIYDVGSVEEVWDLLARYSFYQHWTLTVRALLDPFHVLDSALARAEAGAGVPA